MAQKTFGQAFSEARKQGLDKFEWKGGWYTTKRAEDSHAPTKGGVDKADYKQKKTSKDGIISNIFVVKHDKNVGYYVWDKDLMRQVGNAHKTKEDAARYITSKDVKDKHEKGFEIDAGDFVATAARIKVNRKTPAFQPVDENKNFQGKNGNTRLYQERGTGRYLVTDNMNNIVGYSFDPAAATADQNWGGWIAYTGSKNDLKAAEAGKLRDKANRNEVNQKTKQAHDRITNEQDQQIRGLNRLAAGTNFVTGIMNLPNHAITGAIRTVNPWSDYTAQDYLKGFNVKNYFEGSNQSVGLGDVVSDVWTDMPEWTRHGLNIVNPTSVASVAASYKPTQKGIGAVSHPKGQKVITDLPEEMLVTNGPSPANKGIVPRALQHIKTVAMGSKGKAPKTLELTAAPPKENGISVLHSKSGSNNWFNLKAVRASDYHGPTSGNFKGSSFVSTQPWKVTGQEGAPVLINASNYQLSSPDVVYTSETPTANFRYSGEGNPNTYAQGRITTGEVVPGTSGKNWNGGQSGNKLDVINTKGHFSPSFGGITVGNGSDNKSNWYLYGRHKNGGKLIPRKI